MTDGRYAFFERDLAALAAEDRLRVLNPAAGYDFASNDYLALTDSDRLRHAAELALARGVPLGAGGSRLLRGNHPEHEALEAEAAAFFRAGACLAFGSGYAANVALVSTLPQRGDLILYDELVHASMHEGLKSRRADAVAIIHNDADAFDHAIGDWRARGGKGTPWILVESLYSMDGDRAPLEALLDVAERHDGFLIVDEAHATGVFGAGGRGLTETMEGHPALVSLHTCGKALGLAGGLVTADKRLVDVLVNRARPFIFATAMPPLMAAMRRESLRMVADEPQRRAALLDLVAHAGARFEKLGLPVSGSQILPVVIGENGPAMRVASHLREAGFDVRAVRPPTVPAGTARLRISITLHVDTATIDALADRLAEALAAEEVTA